MNIRVTFVSNYLTIHQISLCREFYKRLGDYFRFVSSFQPAGEKKNYANYEGEPFVIRAYESRSERIRAISVICDSDIIIFGSGDRSLLKNNKKIIFFYLEHLSKTKINFLRKVHLQIIYRKYKNSYLLCASCYSQNDFNSIGLFKGKCFYFGYFPLLVDHNFKKNNDMECINLLWVGRELEWKHPEFAFYAAEILYEENINFNIKIVSTNLSILNKLIELNRFKPWSKNVEIIPPMDNLSVQKLMYSSDIFILSSDKNEGWGAVVNEAMNAGCCSIVSDLAGCSSYLINDGVNGLLFKDYDDFKAKLLESIKTKLFISIGRNAAATIKNNWNVQSAVNNLLQIFELILQKQSISAKLTNNGPGTKIL